jgi:hypothetical protein
MGGCFAAGVTEVLDGTKQPFASLGRAFDATLNFATWDDDLALVRFSLDVPAAKRHDEDRINSLGRRAVLTPLWNAA